MNDVNTAGRLWGTASSDRNGGNPEGRPGAITCHTRSGPGQVPQAHRSQVDQLGVAGIVGRQRRRRRRQQDLAAVGAGPQPGATDDGPAHVVALVAQLRLAGVHRHAHPQPRQLRRQGPLGLHRRSHRVAGAGEGGHHAVTFALLHRPDPTVGGDGVVEQFVMAGDGRAHVGRSFLPQPARPLHVGQQERHRPRRQQELVPHRISLHHERSAQHRQRVHATHHDRSTEPTTSTDPPNLADPRS